MLTGRSTAIGVNRSETGDTGFWRDAVVSQLNDGATKAGAMPKRSLVEFDDGLV